MKERTLDQGWARRFKQRKRRGENSPPFVNSLCLPALYFFNANIPGPVFFTPGIV
jgi:hypothetical protein